MEEASEEVTERMRALLEEMGLATVDDRVVAAEGRAFANIEHPDEPGVIVDANGDPVQYVDEWLPVTCLVCGKMAFVPKEDAPEGVRRMVGMCAKCRAAGEA